MYKRLIASAGLALMFYADPIAEAHAEHESVPARQEVCLRQPDRVGLRKTLHKQTLVQTNAYLFGKSLDLMLDEISQKMTLKAIDSMFPEENVCSDLEERVCANVPDNFLDKEMDLYIVIDRKALMARLFQRYGSEELQLLETKVATGGLAMDYKTGKMRDFSTPSGKYYIKRVNKEPWWIPPEWAKESEKKKKVEPGPKNPYGLWMAELFIDPRPIGYHHYTDGDSGLRLHSTDKPRSIGTRSSHGCVRLHPYVAEELFTAILHYVPHREPRKNTRGTVYPLEKVIPVVIK
jgi:hypothetical protein